MSSHTKKIFANMRRQRQGFFGNVTPLFETMMVTAQEEIKPKRKQRQAAKVHSPSSEILVEKSVSTPSNDPLLSGDDSIQLNELMIFCTNLQQQVFDLEEANIAQAKEIAKLKKRVKKLEKRRKSRPAGLRRLKKGRMDDANMFRFNDLEDNEVIVKKEVSTADPVTTAGEVVTAASVKDSAALTTATTANVDNELTLAETLIANKAAKPKAEMRAEMEEEEMIAREKDEANRVVTEKWDDVQATIDVDRQRKCFAAKRAEEIRNKPPTKVNTFVDMDTENVEEILKKTQAEGRSKRVRQELEQESANKQKLAEQEQAKVADDDTAKLKRCLEIVPEDDDDVAIEATPLSSKSSTIVDYKIYRERKKSYFKIIRADENSQNYLIFRTMFKNFNREDLEVLKSIVKERFKKTKPVDDMENLLFQTLKTMFEPHVEDVIWKYQQGAVKVNN
nr:hypothetical protein [Tanacetum cinerariifolium]